MGDVRPEEDAYAALGDAPRGDGVVGVRPEEVAHGALVGHFLDPVEVADAVEGGGPGREAAVDAEDAPPDEGRYGEVVEEVCEGVPDAEAAELADALVVEAVHLRHGAALVVAPQQRDAVGVAHLERQEQQDRLHAAVAPVHVVPQE